MKPRRSFLSIILPLALILGLVWHVNPNAAQGPSPGPLYAQLPDQEPLPPDQTYWELTGNAGTDPSLNFLGTTDGVSLTLAVSGTAVLRLEPAAASARLVAPNLIGGHEHNEVSSGVVGAVLGGGGGYWWWADENTITDHYGTIGGGRANQAGDDDSTLDDAQFATIGGGENNDALSQHDTVGGGVGNAASGGSSTIAGGAHNEASASYAAVAGGNHNAAGGYASTVGGGQNNAVSGFAATVGGGTENTAGGERSTIGGGYLNEAATVRATIGGGQENTITANTATIGGGLGNTASGLGATIAGGEYLTASGTIATVGGGYQNAAAGLGATIPGGQQNVAGGDFSFAAGYRAQAAHDGAFVWADLTEADFASTASNQFRVRASGGVEFVTGGAAVQVDGNPLWHGGNDGPGSGLEADLLDGLDSTALQERVADACPPGSSIRVINQDGTVVCETDDGGGGGGGWLLTGNSGTDPQTNFLGTIDAVSLTLAVSNTAALRLIPAGTSPNLLGGSVHNSIATGVWGATVGGGGVSGGPNQVAGNIGTVSGGAGNQAEGEASTVGGGWTNVASGQYASVLGGESNSAGANYASVGGGTGNVASASYATVAGGEDNTATEPRATVGGGRGNDATGSGATIAGGIFHDASGSNATVGGGYDNNASAPGSTISGGDYNTASGVSSVIGGGSAHTASGESSAIGGGYGNTASGQYATVPGGQFNIAAGDHSFAGGQSAAANHAGSFVWSDTSGAAFGSTAANQFLIQADGGVGIGTDAPLVQLDVAGQIASGGSDGGFLSARNPANQAASVSLSWYDDGSQDWPRLRYGGSGAGANTGFLIQGQGDATKMAIWDSGYVGIGLGLTEPQRPLHIRAGTPYLRFEDTGGGRPWEAGVWGENQYFRIAEVDGSSQYNRLVVKEGGNVGVGTSDPERDLHVRSSAPYVRFEDTDGGHKWEAGVFGQSNDFRISEIVGTSSSGRLIIEEGGRVKVYEMEILGGSDLAEPFDVSGPVEPGMVVVIDPENPGQLRLAHEAYDHKVAGCVSGANGLKPGLVMAQEGSAADGDLPVALSGRVYCWADATYGPIRPGDLLTTSDTPGHAMAVGDHERAQGAIIGKAMSTLDEGQGLILVLVTLQ